MTLLKPIAMFCIIILEVTGDVMVSPSGNLFVQEDQPVTLNCSDHYSKPNPSLIWQRQKVSENHTSLKEWSISCINGSTDTLGLGYVFICANTASEFSSTLVIPAKVVTEQEHNATWFCLGPSLNQSKNNSIRRQGIRILVLAPVNEINLHTPNNSSKVDVSPSNPLTLHCTTSMSRPQAQIEWYQNDVKIGNLLDVRSNYSNLDIEADKVSTTSYLPTHCGMDNSEIKCKALYLGLVLRESNVVTVVCNDNQKLIEKSTNTFTFSGVATGVGATVALVLIITLSVYLIRKTKPMLSGICCKRKPPVLKKFTSPSGLYTTSEKYTFASSLYDSPVKNYRLDRHNQDHKKTQLQDIVQVSNGTQTNDSLDNDENDLYCEVSDFQDPDRTQVKECMHVSDGTHRNATFISDDIGFYSESPSYEN